MPESKLDGRNEKTGGAYHPTPQNSEGFRTTGTVATEYPDANLQCAITMGFGGGVSHVYTEEEKQELERRMRAEGRL